MSVAEFSASHTSASIHRKKVAILTLGAIGVVFGDLGTSPLYASREALAQTAEGGILRAEILGGYSQSYCMPVFQLG